MHVDPVSQSVELLELAIVMPKITTRKERRKKQREHYLAGEARRPYTHSSSLNRSLTEAEPEASSSGGTGTGVCAKCKPALERYVPMFKDMTHRGSELQKRTRMNPQPKRTGAIQYRDVKHQNEWLRENIFDSMGNYLFCCSCVRAAFGVSKQRLASQRKIKRKQCQEPLTKFSKQEVEDQRLGDYVVMPAGLETAFKVWWRSLPPSQEVDVRFPHARHGNAGKTSHNAKTSLMDDFLRFVDLNSQANGRSADSSGPTFYFLPKFTTIQMPKEGTSHYAERMARSLVGEFNRAQEEAGKQKCSNGSSHNWLKKYRPKHAICPHKQDYCDTCAARNETIKAKQTTLNRLRQASASQPEELKQVEEEVKALKESLQKHRDEARAGHQYFMEVTERCTKEWKRIVELEEHTSLEADQEQELATLKHTFNLVISADYQMAKLVPYWGYSPQPGSTYYLQKLSHDIFGIVNHGSNASTVYLLDERVGPKNTDHTVSYLTHFLLQLPDWIRRIHLFLDNTCSTNKNWYSMAWAFEMVQQGKLDFARI